MPRRLPDNVRLKLEDRNWLVHTHVDQLFSIVEIAKMLGTTPATVTKHLRLHKITSPENQALREASVQRKYGVTNVGSLSEVQQKRAETNLNRFGSTHIWNKDSSRRIHRDNTMMQRYGVTNPGKSQELIDKGKQTTLHKYGRAHYNQTNISDEIYAKLNDYNFMYNLHVTQNRNILQISNILGVNPTSVEWALSTLNITKHKYTHKLSTEVFDKLTDPDWCTYQNVTLKKSCIEIAQDLSVDPWTVQRRFRELGLEIELHHMSMGEKQVAEYIESICDYQVLRSDRSTIAPKELDIYIPHLNLAIEYCGLYWHSENFCDNDRHLDKLELCQQKGIRLLTIFEDEWNNRRSQVEAKLRSILCNDLPSIYARKTTVVEVANADKRRFFDLYHIQGNGPGSITYGLQYDDQLVACMTFIAKGNGRFVLNRYATNRRIVGGFSKLLKHFQRNHTWHKIESFADRRWSEGNVYLKTGFELFGVLKPDYRYVVNGERVHKFNFRHKHLATKLEKYDPNLTEVENCHNHGLYRIFDCGLLKYMLHNIELNDQPQV